MPQCLQKPEGLPNYPIILDKANECQLPMCPVDWPTKSRGQKSGCKKRRQAPGCKRISVQLDCDVELNRSANAWKPGLKLAVEDPEAQKTEELLRKFRSLLNKMTPEKFDQLMMKLTDLHPSIDTEERLTSVTELVFEKSISEPSFSGTYASMCLSLAPWKTQMTGQPKMKVSFKALLVCCCWKEFLYNDKPLALKQKEMEAASSAGEQERLKEELKEAKNKTHRRSMGTICFMGELFKQGMLTEDNMHECILKLVKQHDEGSLEQLCKLLSSVGQDLDAEKAKSKMDGYFSQLEQMVVERKTTSRIRFMIHDIIDLRLNNWVSRRSALGPRTLQQVHEEAKKQEQVEKKALHRMRKVVQREETWSSVYSLDNNKTTLVNDVPRTSKIASLCSSEAAGLSPEPSTLKPENSEEPSEQESEEASTPATEEPSAPQPEEPSAPEPEEPSPQQPEEPSTQELEKPSVLQPEELRENAAVEAEHLSGALPEPSGLSMSNSPAQPEMTAVEAAEPTSPSVPITPPSAESKRKYDRDFLLSLQFMPQCLQKPEGLPNYPIILDKVNELQLPMCPAKSRGKKSGCKKRRQAPGCKRISVQLDCDVELNRSANAWKPGLKLAVEDPEAQKTEELLRKFRSLLNKMTPEKFDQLMMKLTDLHPSIDTEERLTSVTELVFEKSISEPSFSGTYASMCLSLAPWKTQMTGQPKMKVSFKALLVRYCWKEFLYNDKPLALKQKEMEAASSAGEQERLKEELKEAKNKAHRRSMGTICFMGELFKQGMLTEDNMHECILKLVKQHDEGSLEQLCKLLSSVGQDLDAEKAKSKMDGYFSQLEQMVVERKTTSRIRFMIHDIMDLRLNNWVSRRSALGPRTLQQVHEEAKKEEQVEKKALHRMRKVVQREETWSSVYSLDNNRTTVVNDVPRTSQIATFLSSEAEGLSPEPSTLKPENSEEPSEQESEEPSTPATEEPSISQPKEPSTPQPEVPSTSQPEEPSTSQPEEPSAPQSEEPSAPQSEEPSTPQSEEPSAPQSEEPSAPQSEEPSAQQPEEPSAPQPEEPSIPALEEPSAPALEEHSAPETEDPSIPAPEEPITQKLEEPSIPAPEELSASEPEDPSTLQLGEPSTQELEKPSVSALEEPSVLQPEEISVPQSDEPSTQELEEPSVPALEDPSVLQPEERSVPQTEEPSVSQTEEPSVPQTEESSTQELEQPSTTQSEGPSTQELEEPSAPQPEEPSAPEPEEPSAPEPEEPSTPQPEEPSAQELEKPSVLALEEPSVLQPEELSVPQPEEPSTQELEEPSVPALEDPSVLQPEEPFVPQTEEPPTHELEQPSTTQPEEPSTQELGKPSIPVPDCLSIPQLEEPSTQELEEPSVPQPENPSAPQPEEPSIPEPEEPSAPQPEGPSTQELEKPSVLALEEPSVLQPEELSVPQPEEPSTQELEEPSVPALEDPSVLQPEESCVPQTEEPSTQELEQPSTTQPEEPSAQELGKPSIPVPDCPSIPQPEEPPTQELEEHSVPQQEDPSAPQPEEPSIPEPEEPSAPQPEGPSIPEPEKPSAPEPEESSVLAPEEPSAAEPEEPYVPAPEEPLTAQSNEPCSQELEGSEERVEQPSIPLAEPSTKAPEVSELAKSFSTSSTQTEGNYEEEENGRSCNCRNRKWNCVIDQLTVGVVIIKAISFILKAIFF
ncbi:titin-like isoform X3 [Xyrauchen texanus]|uniref:titin-like isoform X2 n=1 Tax=Xyrauchen texanus TaxID=154827 RepID=UPI00224247F8|nr:titin-like isoform X2 [Xyrauchen texanus]XP_051948379.1 titin-like isoform X3 [Xyrauchen texanus]